MRVFSRLVILAYCLICAAPTFAERFGDTVSLAGAWQFRLDADDKGVTQQFYKDSLANTISLPGTTDEAGYGEKTEGPTYGALSRIYKYIGPAWYQRTIDIPSEWKDRDVKLYLERCLWQSSVWVDGVEVGTRDSLGTPHVYELGDLIQGKHLLTIRIDNSMIYNIGEKGHAYGDHMQTIWNGIVGRIELQAVPLVAIGSLRVDGDLANKKVAVDLALANGNKESKSVTLSAVVSEAGTGKKIAKYSDDMTLPAGNSNKRIEIPISKAIRGWDEFTPVLYDVEVSVSTGRVFKKTNDSKTERFGFRTITHDGDHFVINGNKTFMRGNLDNCHFPLTGYPATDVASWHRIFEISKSYGINNIRFHSWCPPEAAFVAADEVGIYLQPEVGIWIDGWMLSKSPGLKLFGKDQDVVEYVKAECGRIINAYGNHPSFVMLSIGNELGGGDFKLMAEIMNGARKADGRRLYACATARSLPPTDDYFVSHRTGKGGTRGLRGPRTNWDYSSVLAGIDVPVIAHELGQWPVYPDFAEIDKYTGTLRARNLEEFRDKAKERKLLVQNKEFQKASGALNVLLYKAEIEASMRTADMGGFHLLGLQDYSGQGEALIGTLDSFYDSKGLVTPKEFRRYCGVTVPLLRISKFSWKNDETLTGSMRIAHYGKEAIENVAYYWTLSTAGGDILYGGESEPTSIAAGGVTDLGGIVKWPLASVKTAQKLTLEFGLKGLDIKNSWDIWVFPADVDVSIPKGLTVSYSFDDETIGTLKDGGDVLLIVPGAGKKGNTVKSRFKPVYWSLTWFAGQPGTLGNLIDDKHPALKGFPTEFHADWQWYSIVQTGNNFVLDNTPTSFRPIVQTIDDFHRNHKLGAIFETKVGKGKLLVCGYDLKKDVDKRPAAKQLLHSLVAYASGDSFEPTTELGMDLLKELLYTSKPAPTVKSPTGSDDAVLYVDAGSKVTAANRDFPCDKKFDSIVTQADGFDYSVKANGAWQDKKGSYWFGEDMQIVIDCPQGFIGKLYVHFHDSNNIARRGMINFEGREFSLSEHGGNGKWLAFDVMREDTLDDKLVLKSQATAGPNLMVAAIALVPNQ